MTRAGELLEWLRQQPRDAEVRMAGAPGVHLIGWIYSQEANVVLLAFEPNPHTEE